jgi:hypothetical protein
MVVGVEKQFGKKMTRSLFLTALLFSLTACTTTTTGQFPELETVKRTVQNSIEISKKAIEDTLAKTKVKNKNESEPVDLGNPSISDEQNFEAVSQRETIESDAERRKQQSSQYVISEPEDLLKRPNYKKLTPIQYALITSHPVGEKKYNRTSVNINLAKNACLRFQSNEVAQDAFLKFGGPKFDPRGIDPDGDGYACGWNPEIYRNLKGS